MKTIEIKESSCLACTRCIRRCSVRAINLINDTATINEDLCNHCGSCIEACPQNAIFYLSDLYKVRSWLNQKNKVVLSLSSSYIGAFHDLRPGQIISAFKKAGFFAVHEMAEASALTSAEYVKLANEGNMENIITTACPAITTLIQKHYPDLLPNLAPVASSSIVHGRYLKKLYGNDVLIVSAGACISKKGLIDAASKDNFIDAVLTFSELRHFFSYMDVNPYTCEDENADSINPHIHRLCPTAGGVISAIRNNKDFNADKYMSFHISNMANCQNVLKEMQEGYHSHCIIEMSACPGGCINGPGKPANSSGYQNNVEIKKLTDYNPIPDAEMPEVLLATDVSYEYKNLAPKLSMPSEEKLSEILKSMGKQCSEDEFDCGACGYLTCRENAIEIFRGHSKKESCIHYLHKKATSLSNLVLQTTPNMIMIIDSDMRIQEFSTSCEHKFHISHNEAIGKDLIEILDTTDYQWALDNKQNLRNKVVELADYNSFVQQNIIYIDKTNSLLVILIDITKEKRKEEEEYLKKIEITEIAQKVIDKQMMTAQMIAGLLGETTAETKLTLNKLCSMLLDEEGGDL